MPNYGLYEQVINRRLRSELFEISEACKDVVPIDTDEAPKMLAHYLSGVLQKGLNNVFDTSNSISGQIQLVNEIISLIHDITKDTDFAELSVDERAEKLLALLQDTDPRRATGQTAADIIRPETSIAQSSLFTGAVHEPQMYSELKKEIISADRIDMLVSFIKWSGLRLIIDELREFTQRGHMRIITTSYMGATDVRAVEELAKLPNTAMKISYDTKRTRLHAKAYVFYRNTNFTTAYVGSSNLSNAAISSGLEWNIKVTKSDLPETITKVTATFESYWNSSEFQVYDGSQKEHLEQVLRAEKSYDTNNPDYYITDITPYTFQQEILDKLEAERTVHSNYRNIVVAATGTGKTIVSALDYKRFRRQNADKPCRLLFIAHREEILKQSLYMFRAVLKDANFGEMFVGSYRPAAIDHLFISVQTLNSQDFTTRTSPEFYDYIVVDEFHHAAAPTYQKLLSYYHPAILLGLTATPERMDGQSILPYFNNRIAAEIRLPEAIDRKLLCPFQYFGVTDNVDLSGLRWRAGGYDKNELANLYTIDALYANRRADLVVSALVKYVTDIEDVKGLGFCASIEHAKFMSRYFNDCNIPSKDLTGLTPDDERSAAKKRLVQGEIRFIFVVDIYNEGVDIPEVNTVLFLRPTESLTVFLQQLGRGLRLAENKECLTVLDFIGQAHKKYNFEDKFAALLSNTGRSITREIKDGFISAPKGCYIQLEKIASRYILDNIHDSYRNGAGLVSRIATFEEDSNLKLTLANFIDYYHLDLRTIYGLSSFSHLCVRAGIYQDFTEPYGEILLKAFKRFVSINSRRWIQFLLDILPRLADLDYSSLSGLENRMLQMFYITIWQKAAVWGSNETIANLRGLNNNTVLFEELIALLQYQYDRINFVDEPVPVGFECPLDLHCTYTRDQILVAMDIMRPETVREGIKWLSDKNIDLFFITLNKSDKDYSPTTMYNDYSINEQLFHWQSQSTTAENSPTGQRYIHHKERGSRILLFVREYKTDPVMGSKSAAAYTFLGRANYVIHEGSKPMNITWRLDRPIPAKFLPKTSKLLVG